MSLLDRLPYPIRLYTRHKPVEPESGVRFGIDREMQTMSSRCSYLAIALILSVVPTPALSHAGRTDSSGGHWDRKAGTYHYHNGGNSGQSQHFDDQYYEYNWTPDPPISTFGQNRPKTTPPAQVQPSRRPTYKPRPRRIKPIYQYTDSFTANVTQVTDGDTIIVVDTTGQSKKIRLYGIDAPEKNQLFGYESTAFLRRLVYGQRVTIRVKDTDRYGRLVAVVVLRSGIVANQESVRNGFAWWYFQYAPNSTTLKNAEFMARSQKLGLWSRPNPLPPWEHR